MKVCVYCRMSTSSQMAIAKMDDLLGIAKRFVEDKGWEMVAELGDYGSDPVMERNGLRNVMDLVQKGQIDIVLIPSLSRLSRHRNEIGDFLNFLERHNVTLFSIDENLEFKSDEDLSTKYPL